MRVVSRSSKKIEKAYEFAEEIYANTTLEDGSNYFEYAKGIYQIARSENEKIVSLLIGVLEHNLTDPRNLLFTFGTTVRDAVMTITPLQNEPLDDLLNRVKRNPIVRAVKIAELNLLLSLKKIDQNEFDRRLNILIM